MDINDLLVMYAQYIPVEDVGDVLPNNSLAKAQALIDADLLLEKLPPLAQKEVMLWASGYTAAEIAAVVSFSERTVWKHLSNSLQTLRDACHQ